MLHCFFKLASDCFYDSFACSLCVRPKNTYVRKQWLLLCQTEVDTSVVRDEEEKRGDGYGGIVWYGIYGGDTTGHNSMS
jgi:hypothetical protein